MEEFAPIWLPEGERDDRRGNKLKLVLRLGANRFRQRVGAAYGFGSRRAWLITQKSGHGGEVVTPTRVECQ
jgi:hypothetical protein